MDQENNQKSFDDYELKRYYSIGEYQGQVPVESLTEKVYGRRVNILEASSVDREDLANDTLINIDLSEDSYYEEALAEFDSTELVLGYDSSWKTIYKRGITAMDYWLSIKRTSDHSEVTHQRGEGIQDLEGATLLDYDGRVSPPGLTAILADLMRRGEIPRGDYLFYHSW